MNWQTEAKKVDAKQMIRWGDTLVIAPHQDDESLGCGGTIALLRDLNLQVNVVFVSDGSMSHPNSKKYPKKDLIALREQESKAALAILSVDEKDITFLRLPDSKLPHESDGQDFSHAVKVMCDVLNRIKPTTILLPWRRDPHKDHRASWQIVSRAVDQLKVKINQLEYFIWLWERAAAGDLPLKEEGVLWKVNIEKTLAYKQQAVAAHVSQTTYLIDDDPKGFVLSSKVLDHFDKIEELFIEVCKK